MSPAECDGSNHGDNRGVNLLPYRRAGVINICQNSEFDVRIFRRDAFRDSIGQDDESVCFGNCLQSGVKVEWRGLKAELA